MLGISLEDDGGRDDCLVAVQGFLLLGVALEGRGAGRGAAFAFGATRL